MSKIYDPMRLSGCEYRLLSTSSFARAASFFLARLKTRQASAWCSDEKKLPLYAGEEMVHLGEWAVKAIF
jgi:hypothetical protein